MASFSGLVAETSVRLGGRFGDVIMEEEKRHDILCVPVRCVVDWIRKDLFIIVIEVDATVFWIVQSRSNTFTDIGLRMSNDVMR